MRKKMYYSYKGNYPTPAPSRIRLSNGLTKTDPIDQEDFESCGYFQVENPPVPEIHQTLKWIDNKWVLKNKTDEEIKDIWEEIRRIRDLKIKEMEWRYYRYYRHERLGLSQIDTIQNLDQYVQALADITKQENPFNIIWPSL